MVLYALTLRPLGFVGSTVRVSRARRRPPGRAPVPHILIPVAAVASVGSIWYLVQEVLGILPAPLARVLSCRKGRKECSKVSGLAFPCGRHPVLYPSIPSSWLVDGMR